MKTEFDTLLALRAGAVERSRCPYSAEELDGRIVRAMSAASGRTRPLLWDTPRRRWAHLSLTACLAAVLFAVTFALPIPSRATKALSSSGIGDEEIMDMVATTLSLINKNHI